MTTKKSIKKFKEGQELNYTGKGFLGFNKDKPKCTFISYDGDHDAYIEYSGFKVLVYRHEIESIN